MNKVKAFLVKKFPRLWFFSNAGETTTFHFVPIVKIKYFYHKYILKQSMHEFMN